MSARSSDAPIHVPIYVPIDVLSGLRPEPETGD